ncbi:MAG: phosphoribosyltransferase family protein [Methanospirillum sp.]
MGPIYQDPSLAGRRGVFADRDEAGRVCAALLGQHPDLVGGALCGAIPSGGVSVAGPIARVFRLPILLLIARKVQVPGNTEFGMGAVAWDGRVLLDRPLIRALGLGPAEVDAAVERAKASVAERLARFLDKKPMPDLRGRRVLVVDDGLAGGSTALAVIGALRAAGAGPLVTVVPTGHDRTVAMVADVSDAVVCPNVRGGDRFAVAEAYRAWRDLTEDEVAALLGGLAADGLF